MKVPRLILFYVLALVTSVSSCRRDPTDAPITIISITPDKGAAGNTVSITGIGFGKTNALSLYFNGTAAVITAITDSSIITVVPTNATTGKIRVSLNGKEAISANDFVILPGTWVRKADLPVAEINRPGRVYASAFAIGNKGYAGAGSNPDANGAYSVLKDWYEYNPATNLWSKKADVPFVSGLYAGVSFSSGNKGYIGIGRTLNPISSIITSEFWEYDAVLNQWTRKADYPAACVSMAAGFGVGTKGYAGFGRSWDSIASVNPQPQQWWEYDTQTNQWTRKADFPGPKQDAFTGFVLNGRIYLGLGGPYPDVSWWEYNPATNQWTQKANFPLTMNLLSLSSFTVGNKGYVAGLFSCWEYNPVLDKWTEQAFFDNYRFAGVAFSIGDKGYYASGTNLGAKYDLWEFTPEQP